MNSYYKVSTDEDDGAAYYNMLRGNNLILLPDEAAARYAKERGLTNGTVVTVRFVPLRQQEEVEHAFVIATTVEAKFLA